MPSDTQVAANLPDLSLFLRPGDTVFWGQASSEPITLTRALVAQRHRLGRLRLVFGIDTGKTLKPEYADTFDFVSYTGGGGNRLLAQAGVLDIFACPYSQLPDALQTGMLKVDVVLVQVSPPDANGHHSLGISNDLLIAALAQARVVIAEVNPKVPRTFGERTLHVDDIDVCVSAQFDPIEIMPTKAPSSIEQEIARRVASLIEDGATLQIGVGGVADAVLPLLIDRRHLGLHSGIVGDGVVALHESGALTNVRKSIDPGVSVTGLLMGSQRLFRWAHENPNIQLRGTRYTHNPEVLRQLDRFVAINSAIEVDLTGQVNAEVAAGQYLGAVGGAPDFLRAAQRSHGGIPIVALASTAGAQSRIVAKLSGPVTTSRSDAGVFVTEHGVADLRGLTLRARMERMIAIAAPEHRSELTLAAAKTGGLS